MRVVTRSFLSPHTFGNDVGAVKSVIKAAPTRVRCVQCKPRIEYRDNQLGSSNRCNFWIDANSCYLKIRSLIHEVADFYQESFISACINRLTLSIEMPTVNLRLQFVASLQKSPISLRQIAHEGSYSRPKVIPGNTASRQGLVVDERVEHFGHLQAAAVYSTCHLSIPTTAILKGPRNIHGVDVLFHTD